jgi:hypothetical protein
MGYKGGEMSFGAKSILRIIFSISDKLKNLFIAFIPAISFHGKNRLLVRKYAAKSFNFLLCLNILLVSANHVVCIELSNERITKAHLQIYECNYPQSRDHIKHMRSRNYETSHTLLLDMMGAAPSCPNCIDQHIQFLESFSGVDFSPETITLFPAYPNYASQHLLLASFSLFHKYKHVPWTDHRLASIRSTILLV